MKKIWFSLLVLGYFSGFSQLENKQPAADSIDSHDKYLYVSVRDLSFIKNNEYFNLIADGYTLFGNRINPEIILDVHPNYDITAGMMLLKYYGHDDFTSAIPYFGLRIKDGRHTYYFGKLSSEDNHHLSRALYDFERQLDARSIENGIEYRYYSTAWESDTWLEWEHFIQKYDDEREYINFGHYSRYKHRTSKGEFYVPFQFYIHHRGGQINIRNKQTKGLNNALVVANAAIGAGYERNLNSKNTLGIRLDAFYHFINSDNTEEFVFDKGKAFQYRIYYYHENIMVHLNYWDADKFVSSKGDDMFQSVSRRVEKYYDDNDQPVPVFAGHTEPDRRLLYGGLIYSKEIYKNLFLQFTTDVFYQLNESEIVSPVYNSKVSGQLDYSMGLYLTYKFKHRLLKL